MHVRNQPHWRHSDKTASFRSHQDRVHPHAHQSQNHASGQHSNSHGSHGLAHTVAAEQLPKRAGFKADVLFFVDHVIAIAVASVACKQAQRTRLAVTGKSGTNIHISVSTTGDGDNHRFVAYNNDMCLFVGSSPTLYVVNQTARELEHAIYLFISERLSGEHAVTAQIFRETGTMFDLPVLEGNSELGPRSLKARQNLV